MKTFLLVLSSTFLLSQAFSAETCKVIREAKVTVTLKDTQHDLLGDNDEIQTSISLSRQKMDEDKMFSELLGANVYSPSVNYFFQLKKVDMPFHSEKVVLEEVVSFDELYASYLNLSIAEKDIQFPTGAGSVDLAFYFASGGNHDDEILSLSHKLNFKNMKGLMIIANNKEGDIAEVKIVPNKTIELSKTAIKFHYNVFIKTLDKIREIIEEEKSDKDAVFKYTKDLNKALASAAYLKDILAGKIEGACK